LKRLVFGLAAFMLLMSSCDSRRSFEEYVPVKNSVWLNAEPIEFKVNISDTISTYNLFAGIRNTELYKYMNLYVFMTVTAPNGVEKRDTIEFILSNVQGEWLGDRAGDILDNRIWFKQGYNLNVAGDYTFSFEQAMRENALAEIKDFGLRLEKKQ
jgi:gliding motility-associated lipoprotein GldH